MAMTKKEKEALESAMTSAALRATSEVKPDVPMPIGGEVSSGWMPSGSGAEKFWSSSCFHGRGERTKGGLGSSSQGGRSLFSTELLALKALRYSVEQRCAQELRRVDRMIEAAIARGDTGLLKGDALRNFAERQPYGKEDGALQIAERVSLKEAAEAVPKMAQRIAELDAELKAAREQKPVATWNGYGLNEEKQLLAELADLEIGTMLYAQPVPAEAQHPQPVLLTDREIAGLLKARGITNQRISTAQAILDAEDMVLRANGFCVD